MIARHITPVTTNDIGAEQRNGRWIDRYDNRSGIEQDNAGRQGVEQ